MLSRTLQILLKTANGNGAPATISSKPGSGTAIPQPAATLTAPAPKPVPTAPAKPAPDLRNSTAMQQPAMATQALDTYVKGREPDKPKATPQQDWASNLAAQAKPIGSDPNSATAKALAYKPKRDWANTTYAGGNTQAPSIERKDRAMSLEGRAVLENAPKGAPVAPHPTVAQNSAILDRNKQEGADVTKKVLQSRTNRENTAAEHAQGFADLNARLDRANSALDAPDRSTAREIMQRPIQAQSTPWTHAPQRRTYNQLMSLYNNFGAGSGMWTPAASEAMVDESGSTTDWGRDNFLTAGKLQDFKRRNG